MATRKLNRLATQVAKLTNPLPAAYKPWGYTFAFDMMVRRACLSHGHPSHFEPYAYSPQTHALTRHRTFDR
jgi:hypothetical protein